MKIRDFKEGDRVIVTSNKCECIHKGEVYSVKVIAFDDDDPYPCVYIICPEGVHDLDVHNLDKRGRLVGVKKVA